MCHSDKNKLFVDTVQTLYTSLITSDTQFKSLSLKVLLSRAKSKQYFLTRILVDSTYGSIRQSRMWSDHPSNLTY